MEEKRFADLETAAEIAGLEIEELTQMVDNMEIFAFEIKGLTLVAMSDVRKWQKMRAEIYQVVTEDSVDLVDHATKETEAEILELEHTVRVLAELDEELPTSDAKIHVLKKRYAASSRLLKLKDQQMMLLRASAALERNGLRRQIGKAGKRMFRIVGSG